MKLSDIKGERTLDVIAEIIEPVMAIAEDKEAMELFSVQKCPEDMEPREFMMQRIKKGIPRLMKQHKSDLIAILAAIAGKTPEEYTEGMNLATVLNDVTELLTDSEFKSFLS